MKSGSTSWHALGSGLLGQGGGLLVGQINGYGCHLAIPPSLPTLSDAGWTVTQNVAAGPIGIAERRAATDLKGFDVEQCFIVTDCYAANRLISVTPPFFLKALPNRLGEGWSELFYWLNQAEIEIGISFAQCLGKRRIPDMATLRHQAASWNGQVNRRRLKINWQFDRKTARRKSGYTKHFFTRSNN